jgi:hypothetical protein
VTGEVRFVDEYRRRLLGVLTDRSPYIYAFKRILIWDGLSGRPVQ